MSIHAGPVALPQGLTFDELEGVLTACCSKTRFASTRSLRSAAGHSSWKARWFALSGDVLTWYTHCTDGSTPELRGQLPLQHAELVENVNAQEVRVQALPRSLSAALCLKVASTRGPPLYVHATDETDKALWLNALKKNIYLATNPRGGRYAAAGFNDKPSVSTPASAPPAARATTALSPWRPRSKTAVPLPKPSFFAAASLRESAAASSSELSEVSYEERSARPPARKRSCSTEAARVESAQAPRIDHRDRQ